MGVKNAIIRAAGKAGNAVAKLSSLSPSQLKEVQERRDSYLAEMAKDNPSSEDNLELASRLLAANSVEVFNSYLPQLKELYVPIERGVEYGKTEKHSEMGDFDSTHNIRFLKIDRWVTDNGEDSLVKLVNVYEVLSNEECNIALVFHRTMTETSTYIAVANTKNADDNNDANDFGRRLRDAIRGNFPGSKLEGIQSGRIPFLERKNNYSVACASNIPAEKTQKFSAQTIEKLLDGIVPTNRDEEYALILLATPILDVENRKLHLGDYYSGLAPYAQWQTNFTYTESGNVASSATFGVNVGASAGIQNGQSSGDTTTSGTSNSSGATSTDSQTSGQSAGMSHADTENVSHSEGSGAAHADSLSVGGSVGTRLGADGTGIETSASVGKGLTDTVSSSASDTLSRGTTETTSKTLSQTTGRAIAQSLGRAVSDSVSKTAGVFSSTSLGMNVGANFARSSTTSVAIGKNEGITQSFTNFNVRHALELLEEQMRRLEESSALGMWEFASYVLSEDPNTANNVAHMYLALTQGEKSYMSQSAVNLWQGDSVRDSEADRAREICAYLRDLRHPLFGLDPTITSSEPYFNVYPATVSATSTLTGKELALALNFPRRSVAGLPVITCAEFGRNVVTYDATDSNAAQLSIGNVFHMHHIEPTRVTLSKDSLASHAFVTGSTGAGKTNTVCTILDEAVKTGVGYLVIEPAKGEYKDILGTDAAVNVYGTNPDVTPLLHLNPFSFPGGIHILEHLDRLVEIFNVCWPMYAAMPAVLKSAVERSYADCGWNLEQSTNPYGRDLWPSFSDVARNVRLAIDASEYDADNKGAYKGSLLTRLESLTNGINGLVFSKEDTPSGDLFDSKAIVDLSRVGSSETKSLIMGILVLKLQEHRMSSGGADNSALKHLTVLEEAHNLLKRASTEQPVEGGNLLGKSVEMISNSIAEMRSYGEGFIIADQAPGLLDMAAIRNTNTKVIMRLPDLTDRELVGRSANLGDDQIAELAKLPRGVAAIYQNEWVQPVLCSVDRFAGGSGRYEYVRPEPPKHELDHSFSVRLAESISSGKKVDKGIVLRDIKPRLHEMGVDGSVQVAIMSLLLNPPEEPRITRVAPIMSALFPDVRRAVVDAYARTSDPRKWTASAEAALLTWTNDQISNLTRRDIIQGIITDYVLNELDRMSDLQRWSVEGNLR